MDASVKLIIYKHNIIFDSIIVSSSAAVKYEQKIKYNSKSDQNDDYSDSSSKNNKVGVVCLNKKEYDAYVVSAYTVTLMKSHIFRKAALKKLLQFLSYKFLDKEHAGIIFIKLYMPNKQFLDYKWNERMTQMVLERREVDHAMSWLSTLGGAFSALGDEFQHCAEIAGKISVKQFELALRLGDPLLLARCKLYAALSLIQRDQLSMPRKIVRSVYKFAIIHKDIRLQNMCRGIWAKLKYCYKIRKEQKLNL